MAVLVPLAAQPSFAAKAKTLPSLSVVAKNFRFLGVPSTIAAGRTEVRLANVALHDDHVFVAVTLGDKCAGLTRDQAIALLDKVGPENDPVAAAQKDCPGLAPVGHVSAGAMMRATGKVKFTAGRTIYFCPISEADGTPHYKLGMLGFADVTAPAGK